MVPIRRHTIVHTLSNVADIGHTRSWSFTSRLMAPQRKQTNGSKSKSPSEHVVVKIRLDRTATVESLRDNWKMATVVQFALSFPEYGSFSQPSIDVIEDDLLGLNDPPQQADILATQLIKASSLPAVTLDNVAEKPWNQLGALEKVETLYKLVQRILKSQRFRDYFDSNKKLEMRVEPIGSKDNEKYYLLDNNRIYRQLNNRWKCVAWDLSSWNKLIQSLKSTKKSKDAQTVGRHIQQFLPIIEQDEKHRKTAQKQREKRQRVALAVANRKRSSRLVQAEEIAEIELLKMEEQMKKNEEDMRKQAELKRQQDAIEARQREIDALAMDEANSGTRITRHRINRMSKLAELTGNSSWVVSE